MVCALSNIGVDLWPAIDAGQILRQSACVSTNAGRSMAPFRARRPLMDQRDF